MGTKKDPSYESIIRYLFERKFREGAREVPFEREDIRRAAERLGVKTPDNPGDLLYSYRYRRPLPLEIQARAPKGTVWVLKTPSKSKYAFVAVKETAPLEPNRRLVETKIPDATPGIISLYALTDEQALLAKVRYNRLIDIFTGVACYSLQSHLRTTIGKGVQVETDEIYVGIDRRGAHYVFPVQAKAGKDKLGAVQIEQDFAVCSKWFPDLVARPIAAQFLDDDVIALFSFEHTDDGPKVLDEKHYRLVPKEDSSPEDFARYAQRLLSR